ncbi:MAG: TIR domain-containing protein [Rubrivivax sp.]
MNLFDWLTAQGLQQHAQTLQREGIEDLEVMRELTEADLEKLGLNMGHRKRLLKALRDLDERARTDAPEASLDQPPSGAAPMAAWVLAPAVAPLQEGRAESGNSHVAVLPSTNRPLRLFLSYGRDEYVDEARTLRDALRKRGHEVWFDEERLTGGLDWEQRIEKGLAACDRVVLAMTPYSVRRPDGYCLNEIAKALELRKLIIPVLMVDVPQGAPTSICRIQYLDWRDAVPARERADRFARRLERLCEAIEEDKLDFEGGHQRLMRYLQPLNYDGDIQRHVARFRGRRQLEARLRTWVEDPQAPQRLWLTAAPGLGKSAVAAALAHRWAETGAVHFCVAGHHDKGDPARAILSIAYQLATHLELYRMRLGSLDLERETLKDERALFDTLLVGPLARDFPAPERPWLVILDGLDEATRSDGSNALAEVVASDWGRLPPWLRLLVSSRPEAEVQQWLAGTPTVELKGDDLEQRQDLADFVQVQLGAAGRPLSETALQRIVTRSEGAFHYAVLLVEEVRQGRCDPEDPVELPAGLNQIYLQSFRRRFPDVARYRDSLRPLLALMLASSEPVPLAVLAGAMGSSASEIRQVLAQLGAMVVIEPGLGESDGAWDTVRASHASLRTWLIGLDEGTRLPLAGVFAVSQNIRGLAAQVLGMWEAAEPSRSEADGRASRCHGYLARVLWDLLKKVDDARAMERVALELSAYWRTRRLALALQPAEFAAARARRELQMPCPGEQALGLAMRCETGLADLHLAAGRTALGVERRRAQLALARQRSALEPGRLEWQLDVAQALSQLGEALETMGDLEAALEETQRAVVALESVLAAEPARLNVLERLADGLTKVGVVLQLKGDFDGALQAYRRNLAMMERLSSSDPEHTGWLFDLGRAHGLVGGILLVKGDLQGALPRHRAYVAAFERLSARDPENAQWLQDLGFSHHHVGTVLESLGDLDGALQEQQFYAAVSRRLCERDPDNAAWQRDLGLSCTRITGLLIAQAKLPQALEAGQQAKTVFGRLSQSDPDDAFSRRECAVAQANLAQILWQMGEADQALQACEGSIPLFESLRRGGTPSSLLDWAAVHALAAQIAEGLGRSRVLAHHEAQLRQSELPPQGVTGPFRRRLTPWILQRLETLIPLAGPTERAVLTLRALRLAPQSPGADVQAWRRRAQAVLKGLPSDVARLEVSAALTAELARAEAGT